MVIVIYLFPAIISIGLLEWIMKQQLSKKSIVYLFASNTLLINVICWGIKIYILGTGFEPISVEGEMLPSVAFNYLIMAGGAILLIVILEVFFYKNIKFKVEDISK